MTVSDGDILQVVADFTTPAGYHFMNRWCWEADLTADQTDATVLAAILAKITLLYDDLSAELVSAIQDPDVFVDTLAWVTDKWEVDSRIGEGIAGTTPTSGADILPFQCSAVCTARTARPRSRGRKFMPPFAEDRATGSAWSAPTMTSLAAMVTEWLAPITFGSGQELIPGVPSDVVGIWLPFLNGFAADKVFTQRRRVIGYGI